jgi:uridine kinase
VALPWTQLPPGVLVLIHSLMTTAMLAVGLVLAARIWRETVHDNDFFRLSRKPFVIGISGDSGAGKDTLAEALRDLFGGHSVASLSGDDYHLWDRHKPMWQVMTHLNPLANDLESFARDLISLCDGRTILTRHYDHATGKMSRPYRVPSNDIIIASGLHALHLPILRSAYDLSIYLDIDEDLRRYLKLKRDVRQRGHAKARVLQSLARRQPDSEKFIRPQRDHADLVFSMRPVSPRFIQDIECAPDFPMRLVVHSRNELNEASLTRVLVGLCGLHVDTQAHPDGGIELSIEGEVEAADVQLASRLMFPKLLEFLDSEPGWVGGVTGLMQLVTLSHINQALTRRFLQ